MLSDENHVGAVLAELLGGRANTRRSCDERLHFAAAGRVGKCASRSDGFERGLPECGSPRFRKYEDVGHLEYLGLRLKEANQFRDRCDTLADDSTGWTLRRK